MNVRSLAALLPHEINFQVISYPDSSGDFCGTHRNNLHRCGSCRIIEISIKNDVLILGVSVFQEKYVRKIVFSELIQIITDDTCIVVNDAYLARDETPINFIDILNNRLIIG